LGANGAGKSTTLENLAGIISPTQGKVTIMGHNVSTDVSGSRQYLGYCTQTDNLFPNLTVEEHLRMFAMIYGHVDVELAVQISIRNLQLDKYSHVKSIQLSGGNKRKLMTCLTLLGAPEVVVLDEPSSGMDPVAQRFLWNTIHNVRRQGNSAVILVSPSFPEIEALCDRVTIICEGRMRCIGTTHYLNDKFGQHISVHVGVTKDQVQSQVVDHLTAALENQFGKNFVWLEEVRTEEAEIRINKEAPRASVADVLKSIQTFSRVSETKFTSLGVSEPSIGDVFSDWIDKVERESKIPYLDPILDTKRL